MPGHDSPPTVYEAFLTLQEPSVHSVLAVTSTPERVQTHRLVTLDNQTRAARLADALNSRILHRRNHAARLEAATADLPLDVADAIRHIPLGVPDSGTP